MDVKKNKDYLGIREIAKLAHVSPSTVSRVINSPERTSEEVRAQVSAVIQKYHYVPNQMAKNLFSKSSNSIALFIHDISNPFFVLLLREISRLAFGQKYTLLTCCTDNNPEREREYLDYCQSIRSKGVIVVDGPLSDIYKYLHNSMGLVSFDRIMDSMDYSSVTSNHYQGLQLLIDHLIGLGHRRIAFAVADDGQSYPVRTRLQSYKHVMGQYYHMPYREEYIHSFPCTIRSGLEIVKYFMSLPVPPTAIICTNDPMAIGVLMGAQHLGLRVPEDLSIVGFDGLSDQYAYPRLTTALQDYKQIAKLLLDNIIDPERSREVHHDVVDVRLSVGHTSGPAPTMTPRIAL